jgi:hypothetical protein
MSDLVIVEERQDTARCCMCFNYTMYWTKIKGIRADEQVPLCQECSFRHVVLDIPDKELYEEKLRIRYGK